MKIVQFDEFANMMQELYLLLLPRLTLMLIYIEYQIYYSDLTYYYLDSSFIFTNINFHLFTGILISLIGKVIIIFFGTGLNTIICDFVFSKEQQTFDCGTSSHL